MTSDASKFEDPRCDDFYCLIAKRYGKHVENILRFLDPHNTETVSGIKPTQITSTFEESNDDLDLRFIRGDIILKALKNDRHLF